VTPICEASLKVDLGTAAPPDALAAALAARVSSQVMVMVTTRAGVIAIDPSPVARENA
jgi:hypothetical protein